jgi:hypothetical protein
MLLMTMITTSANGQLLRLTGHVQEVYKYYVLSMGDSGTISMLQLVRI